MTLGSYLGPRQTFSPLDEESVAKIFICRHILLLGIIFASSFVGCSYERTLNFYS